MSSVRQFLSQKKLNKKQRSKSYAKKRLARADKTEAYKAKQAELRTARLNDQNDQAKI